MFLMPRSDLAPLGFAVKGRTLKVENVTFKLEIYVIVPKSFREASFDISHQECLIYLSRDFWYLGNELEHSSTTYLWVS